MKFPCELLAEPYIAQLRIEVANTLNANGYTQTEIASLLQVSQPVISGYLKKSKNQQNLPQVVLSRAKDTAVSIAEVLDSQGVTGTEEAIQLGCRECKIMRQTGPTCIYHRQQTKHLSEDCTSCLTPSQMVDLQVNKGDVIRALSNTFNEISGIANFSSIVPEIGMQIIYSIENPTGMDDIAAFPGRIIKRKNRQPIADPPTFGSSETTSQILLEIRSDGMNIRAIAALKTSTWLERKIENIGIDHVVLEQFEEDPIKSLDQIEMNSTPYAIIGKNSIGYESISYLCTKDLETLQQIIFNILAK